MTTSAGHAGSNLDTLNAPSRWPGSVSGAYVSGGRRVLVIGPFPPPVHGFAVATRDLASMLELRGFRVVRIDLKSAKGVHGIWGSIRLRMAQLGSVMAGAREGATVYLAFSGGLRQLVDLMFLLVARSAGAKILIHHHSFAYIDRPRGIVRACFSAAGPSATHIVLCGQMKKRLQGEYASVRQVEVLSNVGLQGLEVGARRRDALQCVGYFSALTAAKGIFVFLDVVEKIAPIYPEMQFVIAGPCTDDEIAARVNALCGKYSQLRYVGSVFGAEKRQFLDSLDVLLFPTQYRNEAEPIAIWEAIAMGVPVIAWDRGCIGGIIGTHPEGALSVVPKSASFVERSVAMIDTWVRSPGVYQEACGALRLRFEQVLKESVASVDTLFPAS